MKNAAERGRVHQDSFFSYGDILLELAEERPRAIAVQYLAEGDAETLTLGSFRSRSLELAAWLQSTIAPGDRVLLCFPQGPAFAVALVATLLSGAIAVPVYPSKGRRRGVGTLVRVAGQAGAGLLLTTSVEATHLRQARGRCAALSRLQIAVPGDDTQAHEEEWQRREMPLDAPALIQYTSGSTGRRKGVVITHGNLMANVATIGERFEMGENDCGVNWLPHQHDMGLIGTLLAAIAARAKTVLLPSTAFLRDPMTWIHAISRFRGSICGGPNFAYDLCVQSFREDKAGDLDLSCWKVAFNGAEPIRASTLDRFVETFRPYGFQPTALTCCYGLAEATLLVSSTDPQQPPSIRSVSSEALRLGRIERPGPGGEATRIVGSGRPAPGFEVRVVDPQTRVPLSSGLVGEIELAGPSVSPGYWHNGEGPRERESRFLGTGDLGCLDRDELFVTGRNKDVLVIRGRNYAAADIEWAVAAEIEELPAGRGAAFGIDVDGEEQLVLVHEVERAARHGVDFHRVLARVRKVIGEEFQLGLLAFVLLRPGQLPMTRSGKVRRQEARKRFLDDSLTGLQAWQAGPQSDRADGGLPEVPEGAGLDCIRQIVRDWLLKRCAELGRVTLDDVDSTASVLAVGMDSLDAVKLTLELEAWLGWPITESLLFEAPSIDAASEQLASFLFTSRCVAGLGEEERQSVLAHFGGAEAGFRFHSIESISDRDWLLDQSTAYDELVARRDALLRTGAPSPFFTLHEGTNGATTTIGGRELVNFSSNDYLDMCGDPGVHVAVSDAVKRYGASVSASRIVSGERPLHLDLEREIASFLGVDAALTFVGGNAANVTTIGHLFGRRDLILYDERSHDSAIQGARLAASQAVPFPHNDVDAARAILGERRLRHERVLVFIEGLYSMDGDVPDLAAFVELRREFKVALMVDECLSIGTLGATGRGIGELLDVRREDVDIWMGGISKALGSCGGYIAGSAALIDYLRYTAPGFVYTTGMSPANAAAARASLRILASEPERVARMGARAGLFRDLARQHGLDVVESSRGPVIPVIIPDERDCLGAYKVLVDAGINVQPILYPAVPKGSSRLRFFVSCAHSPEQIEYTVDCLASALAPSRTRDRALS